MNPKNKKLQWGVVMVMPTEKHPYTGEKLKESIREYAGRWLSEGSSIPKGVQGKPKLFFTKAEAEKSARERGEFNDYWLYAAKKYNPRNP